MNGSRLSANDKKLTPPPLSFQKERGVGKELRNNWDCVII
jgi:hypothetical protein